MRHWPDNSHICENTALRMSAQPSTSTYHEEQALLQCSHFRTSSKQPAPKQPLNSMPQAFVFPLKNSFHLLRSGALNLESMHEPQKSWDPLRCVCSVAPSCLTLCDSMDCNPPGSSVLGISQERILEWGAISYSRGSLQPRD